MVNIDDMLDLESKATQGLWCVLDGQTSIGTAEQDICFACIKNKNHAENMRLIVAMRFTFRYFLLELKESMKVVEAARVVAKRFTPASPDDMYDLVKALKELDGE